MDNRSEVTRKLMPTPQVEKTEGNDLWKKELTD
jgi:hypothetical protein